MAERPSLLAGLGTAAVTRADRAAPWLWVGLFAAVTLVGCLLRPSAHGHGTHQQLGLMPCPFVLLFDRPCPACGLTTSWTALLHGDLAGSVRAHALGPALYGLFALSALVCLGLGVRRMRPNLDARPIVLLGRALVVVVLAYGAFRSATTPNYRTPVESVLVQFGR